MPVTTGSSAAGISGSLIGEVPLAACLQIVDLRMKSLSHQTRTLPLKSINQAR
jgi:hypothetical protein